MYTEPEWSVASVISGKLEILKEGKSIESKTIPIGTRLLSFGRLPENSITLEHDSISRYHCIIQIGPGNSSFLYDLNSTHGTFLNKRKIPPMQYVKINYGNDIIQFGASTRMYIIHSEERISECIEHENDSRILESNRRVSVLDFFSSHEIDVSSYSAKKMGNNFTCTIDFSEYLSLDCGESESTVLSSSGSTPVEALEEFYNDCFIFLLKHRLLEPNHSQIVSDFSDDFDDSISEDDFFVKDSEENLKNTNSLLTESEVLLLRNKYLHDIQTLETSILKLQDDLIVLEAGVVDDFDSYINELKKEEIKLDIQKKVSSRDQFDKDLKKFQKILKLLGHEEPLTSSSSSLTNPKTDVLVNISDNTSIPIPPKRNKIKSENLNLIEIEIGPGDSIIKTTSKIFDKEDDHEIVEEAEGVGEDCISMESLKRKYGY